MIYMCVGIVNLSKQVRTIFLSVTSFVLIIFFMFCKKKKSHLFFIFSEFISFFLIDVYTKTKTKRNLQLCYSVQNFGIHILKQFFYFFAGLL